MKRSTKQGVSVGSVILIIFLLGGVLLPATGLKVFAAESPKAMGIAVLLLISAFILSLSELSKSFKQ